MHPRLALAAVLSTALLALTACNDDSTAEADGSTTPSQTGDAGTTGDTDTDSSGTDSSGASFADCSAIPAADMGPALGEGTATAEVPPGGGSCTYALDDPELPSVNLEQFTVDDFADGWEGAKAKVGTTVISTLSGTPESAPGIGDDAVIVTDSSDDIQTPDAIGLVLLGDTVVRATVLDSSGLTPEQVREVAAKILTVIADHA